jgi:hypothetical protein
MSTYLLRQRPIFGHAPAASSLADVLRAHDLGVLCPASTPAALDAAIEIIAAKAVPYDKIRGGAQCTFWYPKCDSASQLSRRSIGGVTT